MITIKNREKIRKFFEALTKVQPAYGKDIGLIVVKKEKPHEIIDLTPNSNLTSFFDLTNEVDVVDFIEELGHSLEGKRFVFIRLYNYLAPAIYNQLYLISNAGRMDYFKLEKDFIINIPKESQLVLISTDEELEKLNCKDLFNVVGPVLRLN